MNHIVLTVGDKEYRLKGTAAPIEAAEKGLGNKSLLAALDDIDQTASFAAILWAALQKYHHGMTMAKVHELIDAMSEVGCSFNGRDYEGGLEMRMELGLEVLKVSGFFTTKQIEEMEAAMPVRESCESMTA